MNFEFLLFIILLFIFTPLLGRYLVSVFQGQCAWLQPLEHLCYKIAGVDSQQEMNWISYAKQLFFFNFLGFLLLFLLLVFQHYLPLNPQGFQGVKWPLAFNIASSFVTNTNWQSYTPETTLSYFSQMAGLTVQNFLSAATGLAALLVFIRGLTRKTTEAVGNFWVDLVRSCLYVLLPLSILFSFFLVYEGVPQTLQPYQEITTMEGAKQVVALGPVASQVAIKQLGTNGGGFFNANSAHPFENPTGLTNFFETLAILLIPASLTSLFGQLIGSKRQGWILFAVMLVLFLAGTCLSWWSENCSNPIFEVAPLVEGKESRLGLTNSVIWSTATTGTSNGSINAQMSSLSALSGGIALFNIMLGELIFGGVGVGLLSLLMFVMLTVFLSGLMVGRTPEYLGKKIERREIQWVILAVMLPSALILIGAGVSSVLPIALSSLGNQGPHGLSEILYALSSAAGNNGSSFQGLNANTDYYNIGLGVVMLLARIAILLPSMAIGGLLAKKRTVPLSLGTFTTTGMLFSVMLLAVILIVGALAFFPALCLGPIVEHLLMLQKRVF